MERDPIKEIKVTRLLDEMLKVNKELYEQILDSNISPLFNEIVNIAMSKHIQFKKHDA